MGSHCNSYGTSGLFGAVFAGLAWYLIDTKSCRILLSYIGKDNLDFEHFRMFHHIAIIVGVVLFVLSCFDFASVLYDIRVLFITAVLALMAAGGMMAYTTYVAFHLSCKSFLDNTLDSLGGNNNVIQAGDQVGISVLVLDLLAACCLISAAITFSKSY